MQPPFNWDKYSDQPHIITDSAFKKQQKKKYFFEYLQMFALFILILPLSFVWQLFRRAYKAKMQIGLGVNLDKGKAQYALVAELGVQYLMVRVPLWDIERIQDYVDFVQGFGQDKIILINILQDRAHIENKALLIKNIHIIFDKFQHIAQTYQICNATNRSKWGFFAPSEYLDFYQIVQQLRDQKFPNFKLVGPSVIDFEYYYTSSSLFNFRSIKFDKLSALLYVDRRGSPDNKQYGFNLKNKIKLLAAMVSLSPKTNNDIIITEVNWPLQNTQPYAPTSQKECVSEADYAIYLKNYINTVKQTQQVSCVYWHQLIAPGYGLVDNRDNIIRKTPAFYDFKQLINENIN